MQKQSKRLLAMVLALCMIIGFVPITSQAALLDAADYITQQMSLGEDIVLHLRGNVPEEYKDGSTATLTFAGQTFNYTINNLTPDEDGLYDMPVEMAVAQLTDEINLVLKTKYLGMNIEAINATYSGRDYLVALIEGNYTRETKALAQELLNFGAAAQTYFKYNTGNLANRGYNITPAHVVPAQIPTMTYEGAVSGINVYGASVRFLSKTAVRFYFTADSVDGAVFTVNGTTYTPVAKDDMYYIEVGGINPQDMDTEMTVQVTKGEETLSFGYTPTNYFVRTYHKSTDENMKALAAAAYSYFMAAQDFAGVTDTADLTFQYASGNANSITVNTNLATDIPLVDFALTDNGCSVNENACDQKATNVSMANVDGVVTLTFNFANAFTAGQVYSLPGDAFFAFTDNSQYALADDYLFQFNGTDWTQVTASGDFTVGVNFEDIGNTLLFSGEGPATKAALVKRVAHNTEIPALTNGGDYALKLTHASSYYPTFRINFGKELAAGTVVNFMAFGVIYGDSKYDHSIFEFNNGGEATIQFTSGEWTQLTFTLAEAAEYVDLFWNFDRAQLTNAETTGAVYVDNFIAVEPVEAEGDFTQGITFEAAGNAAWFVGQGITDRDAVIVRAAYENESIPALANGGDYALKLSHPSNYWPTFRINFGKELAAGTKITFMAYGKINGESNYNQSIFEFMAGGEATAQFKCDKWTELTMTLADAASYVDLYWNIDRASITSSTASGEVYIDNMIAVEPVQTTGDILEGYGFEVAGNEGYFTGIGAPQDATFYRVPYAFAGIEAPENGGEYALKVSHTSHYYPTFQLNFGKTLEAGTTITFDVMGSFDGWVSGNDMNIEFTGDSGSGQVVYMVPDTWFTATISLDSDRDHLQFFYNIERGNGISGDVASRLYIDNVKATEPPVEPCGDFTQGIDFETEGNELRFTATGAAETDATIERVAYADLGIEVPADGGSYALKVSHDTNAYPTFRIEFGKTLKAGTTINFDAYAIGDGDAIVLMNADWTQAAYLSANAWRNDLTWEITLSEDCDHIDMLWESRGNTNVASAIIIDNIVATEPAAPEAADFIAGVTFENAGHASSFVGTGNDTTDATIAIVSYADLGIEAPADGGSYALKVSHDTNAYPTFRIEFGKTLKAGTTINFDAYAITDGSAIALMNSAWTQAAYLPANAWRNDLNWEITLTSDCSYIDMLWESRDNTNVASAIVMDNIVVTEPDTSFKEGVTFEQDGDMEHISGQNASNDAVIERVSYTDAGISAASNGGSYAAKLTHASNQWPAFQLNLGKTYPAGTVLTYYAYSTCASMTDPNTAKSLVVWKNSAGTEIEMQSVYGQWTQLKMTLDTDTDVIKLYWNMDQWDIDYACTDYALYLDGFVAAEPISGTITFENAADIGYFGGTGNATTDATVAIVSYAELGIEVPSDGGSYALKVSHDTNAYPTFRISFGKTLKAGTTVKFDAYGINDGTNVVLMDSAWTQAAFLVTNAWRTDLTWEITLSEDCSYIDMLWESRGQSTVPSAIIMDNIEFTEPA